MELRNKINRRPRTRRPAHLSLLAATALFTVALVLFSGVSTFANDAPASVQLKLLRTIQTPYVINRLAWHPNNKELAVGQSLNKKVTIWNVETGQVTRVIDKEAGGVGALAYSLDGKYLAVGRIATRHISDHAHVHLYNTNIGELVYKFVPPAATKGDANDVNALIFSPDNRYLVTHGYGGGAVGVVYDLSGGAVVIKLDPSTSKFDAVRSLAWSPGGQWVAVGRVSGRLELWNATSWKLEKQSDISRQGIGALAFSPDNQHLALGSFKRSVEQANADAKEFSNLPENFRRGREAPRSIPYDFSLLDTASLAVSSAFASSHSGSAIRELTFTPDGKFLVSGANAKSIAMHETSTGREALFIKDFKLSAHPALSKDGRYLAVGTGQEIRLYEFTR